MKNRLLQYFKENSIIASISFVAILVMINFIVSYSEKKSAGHYETTAKEVAKIKGHLMDVNRHVNVADMALRGFYIIEDQQILHPYTDDVLEKYEANYDILYQQLDTKGFDVSQIPPVKARVKQYMGLINHMVALRKQQKLEEIAEIIKSDPGYEVWKVYSQFVSEATIYVEELEANALKDYEKTSSLAFWVQILLCVIGLPTLFFSILKIRSANRVKQKLFFSIEENNRKLIFDPQNEGNVHDQASIISDLIENLRKISSFIKGITQGNYSVDWDGLSEGNKDFNKENIVGDLINMREQMKAVKEQDERRLWSTEGISKFSEIVRSHQNDITELSDQIISQLVKYLKANQGGLFILNDIDPADPHLELTACYAFQRKKYLTKRIELGEGLVGQAYLEQDFIYMTQIPKEYISITSGLGDANPTSILIVPLIYNEKIEAVVELASFSRFSDYEIEFIQKIGEHVASAIASVKVNEKTRKLLEMSQVQAEEMRAQEEEMRQNMEELQATQEEIQRRTLEYQEVIESNHLEMEVLKEKVKEFESLKK